MAVLHWTEVEPGVIVSSSFTVEFNSVLSEPIGFEEGQYYQLAFGGCGNFLSVSPAPRCVDVAYVGGPVTIGTPEVPAEVPLPGAGLLMGCALVATVLVKRISSTHHRE